MVRKDNSYGALVREPGRLLATIHVETLKLADGWLESGYEKVCVTTMGGGRLFEQVYAPHDECRLSEVKDEVRVRAYVNGLATMQTKIEFTKKGDDDYKPLHSNAIIKAAAIKESREERLGRRQQDIREFLKRKRCSQSEIVG